jgi:hypothetical protein
LVLGKKKVLLLKLFPDRHKFFSLQDTFSCLLASYKFGPLDANNLASPFCWVLFHIASTDFTNLLAGRSAPRGAAGDPKGVEPLWPQCDYF